MADLRRPILMQEPAQEQQREAGPAAASFMDGGIRGKAFASAIQTERYVAWMLPR